MTAPRQLAAHLYLANAVVLITHEIDSAYWHEWELFRLPGGIDLFLVLHIGLVGFLLYGFRRVVLWERGAKVFSYVLAGAGLFAFSIHSVFLAQGHPQFRAPVSLTLLLATLALSIWQLMVLRACDAPRAD